VNLRRCAASVGVLLLGCVAAGVLAARAPVAAATAPPAPPPRVAPRVAAAGPPLELPPVEPRGSVPAEVAADPRVEAALLAVERLRAIPGAASRVDRILAYLKGPGRGVVTLAHLPRDARGVARLDDDALARVIPDPEVRAAWRELAALVARARRAP